MKISNFLKAQLIIVAMIGLGANAGMFFVTGFVMKDQDGLTGTACIAASLCLALVLVTAAPFSARKVFSYISKGDAA